MTRGAVGRGAVGPGAVGRVPALSGQNRAVTERPAADRAGAERAGAERAGEPGLGLVSGLGAVAVAISFIGLRLEHAQRPALGVGAAILGLILLVAAHRRLPPIAVLLGVAALDLATLGLTSCPVALRPLVAVALYLAVRQGERSRAKLAVAVGVAVVVAGIGAPWQDGPLLLEWASDAAVLALPIVAAEARRSDRDRRRSALEREVAERVYAERLRIAADLHDVVAHSLSAIAVQSGIAEHLFERDPQGARQALADINTAGRRALDELRDLLGVLRSADAAPLRPVPGDPDDLQRVVSAALQAGSASGASDGTGPQWPVSVTVEGSYPPDTSEATVVAVHRIVHEALVNVARHAGRVGTSVNLAHGPESVEVRVINAPPGPRPPAGPSTGAGIIGMTERAELLGGRLSAGPLPDGGFEVRAVLPYRGAHRPVGTRGMPWAAT